MNTILACRLEVSPANNLELDALMLEWLADMPAIDHREMWLRHSYGLVGCMTGALRLLADLCPAASWTVASRRVDSATVFIATLVPSGGGAIFAAEAADPANALLSVLVRVFDAGMATGAEPRRQTSAILGDVHNLGRKAG